MPELKVVSDANVFISGLLWEGIPHKIIKLAEKEQLSLLTTASILEEVNEALMRDKFKTRIDKINTLVVELIESLLSLVEIIQEPKVQPIIKDDPDDDKILACALACKADIIVSGDFHLLNLKQYENIAILTPRQFWQRYGQQQNKE